MSRYLITGGAGFIGSNLAATLLQKGEHVRVLDNFSTGRRENLAALAGQIDPTEIIEGDIRSYHIVQQAVRGVDFILHQAALPSVPRSVSDPITTNEVNVQGTLNVLYAARAAGVKRLVFASSSSVYGDRPELPKHEAMEPLPLSPYAVSKLTGEYYCRVFRQLYGFETVCLRYFNVFGPRQDPHSQYAAVIPRFITAMLQGTPLTIYGDGTQSRDFTFIANVVQANLLACTAPDAAGGVFNIACGERISLLELVTTLSAVTDRVPEVQHTAPRPGDVPHSQADITRARTVLAYQPSVGLEAGLRETVAALRPS